MTYTSNQRHTDDRPMPDIFFKGMSAMFKVRDLIKPPRVLMDEVAVKPGDTVLDYGCGPGSYIPELVKRVGTRGTVVAVDIHPLAIKRVEVLAKQQRLPNVKTVLTDGVYLPNLVDCSVDSVILFDVFHMLGDQRGVLMEIYRVLRPGGTLSVNDPHMSPDNLIAGVTNSGHFQLSERKARIITFTPAQDLKV